MGYLPFSAATSGRQETEIDCPRGAWVESGAERLEPQGLEIAGHQTTLSAFDISQSPKAIVLQLEDVIRIVERFFSAPQAHRADSWKRTHSRTLPVVRQNSGCFSVT